jgi:hypothetical protein
MLTEPGSVPVLELTPTLDIPVTPPTIQPEDPAEAGNGGETAFVPTPVGDPYVLKDRKGICDVEFSQVLQVYVVDKNGMSVPGAEVFVTWGEGEDHFFTGMKPAIDIGYADFIMEIDQLYNVRMANGGETVTKVVTPNCRTNAGMDYKGGVKIIFGAP